MRLHAATIPETDSDVHLCAQFQALNSTFNNVGRDQYIYNTIVPSPLATGHTSLQPFNDAPIDLLTTHFTGRRDELDFLRETFKAAPSVVPIRCVVYGMPGIGKTNLVLQYAKESFDCGWYSHVLWMSGTTVDKLNEGMAKILDLVEHPERHRTEQGAKLTAVRRWLEDSQGDDRIRWLLVIDNVDRKALGFLREHLPRSNARSSILFTTRTADVADALVDVTGPSHRKLDIRVPDIRDTTRLFFSSAGIETDSVTPTRTNEAEKLIGAVGSLPLAIVHAASYMKQTHTSLGDMLQLYQSEYKGEMLRWENDLTLYQEQSVTATFEALFFELDRDSPSVANFLKLLSFLDPERIPLNMLVDGANSLSQLEQLPITSPSRPAHNTPGNARNSNRPVSRAGNFTSISSELNPLLTLILSPIRLTAAIRKLQTLSLVERLSHDDQPSLRIHDLVQYIISERAKQENTYPEWLRSAVSLVCRAFDHVEEPESPLRWLECEIFVPHLHSLNDQWGGMYDVNLDLAEADLKTARYLNSRGRYDDAGVVCKRSSDRFEKGYGSKHEDTLEANHTLAWIYFQQGRSAEAEALGERILEERKKTLGADHNDTLTSMNNLAFMYAEHRRLVEAEELLKQVLAGFGKNLGPDIRCTLTVMDNLAEVYLEQERYDDAERLFKLTLAGKEKNLGMEDMSTLVTVHNLAIVYQSQRRYAEAEELYTRALFSKEKQLGTNHASTTATVFNLAHLCRSQGRQTEAEEYFKRAFSSKMNQLGASHPDTSQVARELVELYRSQGRDSDAEAILDTIRSGRSQ